MVSLLGGILIGLAAAVLLVVNGRIAGISGITFRLFDPRQKDRDWRLAFLLGLVVAGLVVGVVAPQRFSSLAPRAPWLVAIAGVLTGVGTALANGCTSGHGIAGMGRGSLRSVVATCTFMATAGLTVFVTRHL